VTPTGAALPEPFITDGLQRYTLPFRETDYLLHTIVITALLDENLQDILWPILQC
jgi:hypothetical protein